MAKTKTVKIEINVPVSYLKTLIKEADAKIKDKLAFDAFINSDEFSRKLGDDLFNVWMSVNEDSDPADLVDIFGDTIEFTEDDLDD